MKAKEKLGLFDFFVKTDAVDCDTAACEPGTYIFRGANPLAPNPERENLDRIDAFQRAQRAQRARIPGKI